MAKRKRLTSEQIILKLREAEVLLGQEKKPLGMCAGHWRFPSKPTTAGGRSMGGMNTNQAKKLKTLEKENTRLKTLVAELSFDNEILKEVLSKK